MGRIREGACVCVRERAKSKFVCVLQEQASADSERAWHSAYQTVCVAGGPVCGSAPPLGPVRNLPFSLLKAGETMERVEVNVSVVVVVVVVGGWGRG